MGPMDLPVMPPVKPMLAKSAATIPTSIRGAGVTYEPKWDGFRSIIFRDGEDVEIGSRNERPMTRYFPELVDAVREHLPERCVVDGEVIVINADGVWLDRSEEHTSELQSRGHLVCRLLLEKKK